MPSKNGNECLTIRDLGLAAALVSAGYVIASTECDPVGRVYFSFENTKLIQLAANQYWDNELLVSARQYNDSMKTLKNLIYGIKGAS